jgi:hypothetical protein
MLRFLPSAQASRYSGEHVASRIVVVGNQHMLQGHLWSGILQ